MKYSYSYPFPVGTLHIVQKGESIIRISFRQDLTAVSKETNLIRETARQLDAYFNGTRTTFDIPLQPEGTPFQQKIWALLQKIPYGKTMTYKQLATLSGNANACRAVGMANNRNPIMIVIPCHRVIGADGSLTGYAGGLEVKQFLLQLEKAVPAR
ncbi:MAG: methylated-DNA--[protein]-cysteine S-methyltransferase [Coprobacter sp.]|nr:methylated-DNA--[protein]-cysteine S-methyltransferase [Coprobacter sp.]